MEKGGEMFLEYFTHELRNEMPSSDLMPNSLLNEV